MIVGIGMLWVIGPPDGAIDRVNSGDSGQGAYTGPAASYVAHQGNLVKTVSEGHSWVAKGGEVPYLAQESSARLSPLRWLVSLSKVSAGRYDWRVEHLDRVPAISSQDIWS